MINIDDVLNHVPSLETLKKIDALLYAVYKWKPDKLKKMRLSGLGRWCKLAQKRMTYGDAYLLNKLLEPKEIKWWKKIFSKTKN